MADKPFIQAVSIFKKFEEQKSERGLRQIDFQLRAGHILAIVGESGSGKSTLLRLIYGLIGPDSGSVLVSDIPVPRPEDKLIPGHEDMRMVSQHFDDLNTYAKVWDNIASRLSNTNLEFKRRETEKVLEQLSIVHLADQRVADLSGGERQRVAIARALVTQPKILLMDEPFNQVDASFRDALQRDIRQIVQRSGLTVLLVSHDPAEVLSIADELLMLKDGVIMASGPVSDIYQNPPNAYTAVLLAKANVLDPDELKGSGIASKIPVEAGKQLLLYPEWLQVAEKVSGAYKVTAVLFKGPYEELLVSGDGISLRIFNALIGAFPVGTTVDVQCARHLWVPGNA